MCNPPAPEPMKNPPPPIQPRNPDVLAKSKLPAKKELIDPEDITDVEYGSGTGNQKTKQAATRMGTDALKINLNTGTGTGGQNINTGTP
tara:strand:- start:591 stop:857 length:267 start_codon:yes stop_codon:yes gene_type:complete